MSQRKSRALRWGEAHHRARYTNGEIEMVRRLRDEGHTYLMIARWMEMPKSTVRDIVLGLTRVRG